MTPEAEAAHREPDSREANLRVIARLAAPSAPPGEAPHYWVGNRGVATGGNIPAAPQSATHFTFPDGTTGPGNWNPNTGEVEPAAPSAPSSGDLE